MFNAVICTLFRFQAIVLQMLPACRCMPQKRLSDITQLQAIPQHWNACANLLYANSLWCRFQLIRSQLVRAKKSVWQSTQQNIAYRGPKIWTSLPEPVRRAQSLATSKSNMCNCLTSKYQGVFLFCSLVLAILHHLVEF